MLCGMRFPVRVFVTSLVPWQCHVQRAASMRCHMESFVFSVTCACPDITCPNMSFKLSCFATSVHGTASLELRFPEQKRRRATVTGNTVTTSSLSGNTAAAAALAGVRIQWAGRRLHVGSLVVHRLSVSRSWTRNGAEGLSRLCGRGN